MTPIALMRAAAARRDARRHYLVRAEALEELARWMLLIGEPARADRCHEYALIALRAYIGETDDSRPKGLPA